MTAHQTLPIFNSTHNLSPQLSFLTQTNPNPVKLISMILLLSCMVPLIVVTLLESQTCKPSPFLSPLELTPSQPILLNHVMFNKQQSASSTCHNVDATPNCLEMSPQTCCHWCIHTRWLRQCAHKYWSQDQANRSWPNKEKIPNQLKNNNCLFCPGFNMPQPLRMKRAVQTISPEVLHNSPNEHYVIRDNHSDFALFIMKSDEPDEIKYLHIYYYY